jgi:hypothetical protein
VRANERENFDNKLVISKGFNYRRHDLHILPWQFALFMRLFKQDVLVVEDMLPEMTVNLRRKSHATKVVEFGLNFYEFVRKHFSKQQKKSTVEKMHLHTIHVPL